MNPLLKVDYYKTEHFKMYPDNMTKLYSNFTPRKSRIKGIDKVVFFGLQHFILEYLIKDFNENFFGNRIQRSEWTPTSKNSLKKRIITEYSKHIKLDSYKHIEDLWDLGYLPIEIKALEEGTLCPIGVPCFTITNTHSEFAWLTNYLETLISCMMWQPITSATIACEYRKLLNKYAIETTGSIEGVQWQGHDFSMRGMSSVESSILSGMGHLTSFTGTDVIPAIYQLESSYDATGLIGASVPATEHSVMCMGTKDGEIESFKRLLDLYPNGILSVVSDTWDLWKVCTKYLSKLKEQILARDGKLVIRPDCLDEDSQILTPRGWIYFKNLNENDLVAQVKEDQSYEFVKPLKIINQEYEGDMYHITDFYGKIDLMVTPNHRLVSYREDESISIKEASVYKQNHWSFRKLRSPKAQDKGIKLSWYERFLIALQADGCIKYVNKDNSVRIEFNFQKERKHIRLLKILQNLDLEYSISYPKSREGQSTFSILVKDDKEIVSKTFQWVNTIDLDYTWSCDFIEELKYWDSSIRNKGRFKYDSIVKFNLEVVELIAIAAGKGVYISKTIDDRKEHFSDVYTAHILDEAFIGGQSLSKTKINYKGRVYCVKVPTGMILVKRNKGICVTGNSGDPVDIICGKEFPRNGLSNFLLTYEHKGVIELLWDIFGGTINKQGYKVLDSHIGAIYGDSITLDRAQQICERLKTKGFASTNIILGIGSYTYQYNTRDTFGLND